MDAFRAGPHGTLTGTVTSEATGHPLAGAQVVAGTASAITDASGGYVLTAPPGTYNVIARDFGYQAKVADGVNVVQGQAVTENFALTTQPSVTVSGSVTDGSGHGWGLAATVSVPGTPVSAQTDPATGRYRLSLPGNAAYTVQVASLYPGYRPAQRSLTIGTAGVRDNFALAADDTTCQAPGYRLNGHMQVFAAAQPPGWSVITPKGTSPWAFAPQWGIPNYTGGRKDDANVYIGPFAKQGTVDHTDLVTSAVNMLADRQPVLRFDQALYEQPALRLEIDLSIDGGRTWSAIWKHSGFSIPPYSAQTQTIALPAAVGQPDVRVRFQFIDTSEKSGDLWELDNIYLGDLPCAAIPGGLVTGQVVDGNTGEALDGATVTSLSGRGRTTLTGSTPPALGSTSYSRRPALASDSPRSCPATRRLPP